MIGDSDHVTDDRPPVYTQVFLRATPDAAREIASRPNLKWPERRIEDPTAAAAGFRHRAVGSMQIYDATGTTKSFTKIMCSEPGGRTAESSSSSCSAYFAVSPKTEVEVVYFEPHWTISTSKALFDRIQTYLDHIKAPSRP